MFHDFDFALFFSLKNFTEIILCCFILSYGSKQRGFFLVPEFKSLIQALIGLFSETVSLHHFPNEKRRESKNQNTAKYYIIKIVYQALIIDLINYKNVKSKNIWRKKKVIGLLSHGCMS